MSNTYSSFFGGLENRANFLLSENVQKAFQKSFIPNINEFPTIDDNLPTLTGPILNVYKLKNTKFLESGKIKIKTAEQQLSDMLNSPVHIIRENNNFFIEVYRTVEELRDYIKLNDSSIRSLTGILNKITSTYSSSIHKKNSNIILGETALGNPYYIDLFEMNHLLVIGTTGSGKTNFVQNIIDNFLVIEKIPVKFLIYSELYKNENLAIHNNLILDYKNLENSRTSGFSEKLKVLYDEIELRKKSFNALNVNSISEYNNKSENNLPQILFIIEELDRLLMMSAGLKDEILRLLAVGRAYGVTLIATAMTINNEVITPSIRSSFPSVMLFKVKSLSNGDIISLNLIGKEGGATIPCNGIGYFMNQGHNPELIVIPNSNLGISGYNKIIKLS